MFSYQIWLSQFLFGSKVLDPMESMETVGNVTDTLPREDFGSARPCEVAAPH